MAYNIKADRILRALISTMTKKSHVHGVSQYFKFVNYHANVTLTLNGIEYCIIFSQILATVFWKVRETKFSFDNDEVDLGHIKVNYLRNCTTTTPGVC